MRKVFSARPTSWVTRRRKQGGLNYYLRSAQKPTRPQDSFSRFTQAFEDQTAWLVTHTSRSAVSELMRVAWRTVSGIITRVIHEAEAAVDP